MTITGEEVDIKGEVVSKKKSKSGKQAAKSGEAKGSDASIVESEDAPTPKPKVVGKPSETHRVKLLVSVNSHRINDEVTVGKSHPFYNGLIAQNLAKVIG